VIPHSLVASVGVFCLKHGENFQPEAVNKLVDNYGLVCNYGNSDRMISITRLVVRNWS